MQTPVIISVLSGVGMLGGLFYAFKTKKKFWGYVGFAVLGSIAGSITGGIISQVVPKKKTETKGDNLNNSANVKKAVIDTINRKDISVDDKISIMTYTIGMGTQNGGNLNAADRKEILAELAKYPELAKFDVKS